MIQFLPWLMAAGSVAGGAGSLSSAMRDTRTQVTPPVFQGGDSNPMAEFFTGMDQQGRPEAPSGVQPNLPTGTPSAATPPTTKSSPTNQQGEQKAADRMSEIGDILQSIPEALAIAAPLLGLTGGEERKIIPGQGGGSGMNPYASAFGPLPKPPSLGELIAALPRMR